MYIYIYIADSYFPTASRRPSMRPWRSPPSMYSRTSMQTIRYV